jgi:integrase
MTNPQSTTPRVRLTKSVVDAIPVPPKGEKPTRTYDADLPNYWVQTSDQGTKSYYTYGRPGGRQVIHKIGRHGQVTPEQARALAKKALGAMASGIDPGAQRRAARQDERSRLAAPTMADLCARYLAEHVAVHNKPKSQALFRRLVEKFIVPELGGLKVAAVDHEDVVQFHRDHAQTPRQANHLVSVLSMMFNLAERWKDKAGKPLRPLNSNPCRHLKRYRENARERFLSPDELQRLGQTLRDMEAEGTLTAMEAAIVRLLALTGCRVGELIDLRWRDVDLKAGVLRLPDSKTGAKVVALGAPAQTVLAALDRGHDADLVFGLKLPRIQHLWNPSTGPKAGQGIRDRAGLPDVRLHDLRHGYGTAAGALGLNAFMIRDLLGHKTVAMTSKYVARNVDPLKAAADVVSGQIAAQMDGPSGEVMHLRR